MDEWKPLVAGSSTRLFGAGVSEKEALDRLRYVGPGVHKWTRQLVMQRPPPMQSLGAGAGGPSSSKAGAYTRPPLSSIEQFLTLRTSPKPLDTPSNPAIDTL